VDSTQARSIEANRDLWDKRVRAHLAHGLYPSARVLDGSYDVGEPDVSELGDVAGLRLVHLQCNGGADTLAWARRGATVTGVDFSADAIDEARRLAAAVDVDATFIRADVYALPDDLGTFDVVYSSMGVLWWLPDLDAWARVTARLLAPGGRFYLNEIHPLATCLVDVGGRYEVGESYFGNGEPIVFETSGTYYDAPPGFAAETAVEHGWVHDLGQVVTALCRAGLRIEHLHEHAYTTWRMHPSFERDARGYWQAPSGGPRLPLTFSVLATR
jgi:SAM-dependent methyltransferase